MEQQWPAKNELFKMNIAELEALIKSDAPEDLRYLAKNHLITRLSNANDLVKAKTVIEDITQEANETQHPAKLINANIAWGMYYRKLGQYDQALEHLSTALKHEEVNSFPSKRTRIWDSMSGTFALMGMTEKSIALCFDSYNYTKEHLGDVFVTLNVAHRAYNLALLLNGAGRHKEALVYINECLEILPETELVVMFKARSVRATAYIALKEFEKGIASFRELMDDIYAQHNSMYQSFIRTNKLNLGTAYLQYGQVSKGVDMLLEAEAEMLEVNDREHIDEVFQRLYEGYEELEDYQKALGYYKKWQEEKQTRQDAKALEKAYNLEHQLDLERKEKEFEKRLGEARLKTLAMLAGEMAHEIQNPLQFVNNFSKFNLELLDDIDADPNDADARMDLRENCEKILEHGQRISKIVAELQDKTNKAQAGELELPTENVHDFSK